MKITQEIKHNLELTDEELKTIKFLLHRADAVKLPPHICEKVAKRMNKEIDIYLSHDNRKRKA